MKHYTKLIEALTFEDAVKDAHTIRELTQTEGRFSYAWDFENTLTCLFIQTTNGEDTSSVKFNGYLVRPQINVNYGYDDGATRRNTALLLGLALRNWGKEEYRLTLYARADEPGAEDMAYAEAFASELLLPEDEIRSFFEDDDDDEEVRDPAVVLMQEYKVPLFALYQRLKELDLL